LKRSKCFFGTRSMTYLGHVISVDDVAMDSDKVRAIMSWSVPSTVHVMHTFLSLVDYYRRLIRDFRAIAAPLTRLLRKAVFKWCFEAEVAF
jgi:hypothetical protein